MNILGWGYYSTATQWVISLLLRLCKIVKYAFEASQPFPLNNFGLISSVSTAKGFYAHIYIALPHKGYWVNNARLPNRYFNLIEFLVMPVSGIYGWDYHKVSFASDITFSSLFTENNSYRDPSSAAVHKFHARIGAITCVVHAFTQDKLDNFCTSCTTADVANCRAGQFNRRMD